MKKRCAVLIAVFLCVAFMGCASKPVQQTHTPAPQAQEPGSTLEKPNAQAPEEPQVPTTDEVKERIALMLPIVDSLVRKMGISGDIPYAPKDPDFFWSTLYLMGENWGATHPLVERDGDTVVVPRKVMQEFASAAFYEYDDLLPLPDGYYGEMLHYDEGLDAYRLAPSDMGDTVVKFDTVSANGEEIQLVAGLYLGSGEKLGALQFTLAENPYADGISEPIFYYTVTGAQLL